MTKRRVILLSVLAGITVLIAGFFVMVSAMKRRAGSMSCASSVTSICLGGRLWAEDHGGLMPTNFLCMSNELNTPKVLSCQPSRRAQGDWSSFTPENCTYEIVTPGMPADETNKVFLRCTIHGHLGYCDGTVFDGVRRRHKFD